LLDPMPTHIIKAYYNLRLLKSRDFKIKLLSTLNYFRAVQRTLCNDLRELNSRDRVTGDIDFIGPTYEDGGLNNEKINELIVGVREKRGTKNKQTE